MLLALFGTAGFNILCSRSSAGQPSVGPMDWTWIGPNGARAWGGGCAGVESRAPTAMTSFWATLWNGIFHVAAS